MNVIKPGQLLPCALFLLLACGGSGNESSQPTPAAPKAIPADEAMAATWGFLTLEHGTSLPSQMPAFIQAGDAKILTTAPSASCVTVETTTKMGITLVEYTFSYCGAQSVTPNSLNGSMSISFSNLAPSFYTVEYKNLVATHGTQTWTFNGTKTVNVDLPAKQANLTATNLSAVFADTAHPEANRAYLYNANLSTDWAAANSFKVAGTYSLNFTLAAATYTTSGLIPIATPLTWMSGCCYPSNGAIAFTKGDATATATFTSPCGTMVITPAGQAPQIQLLPACGQ